MKELLELVKANLRDGADVAAIEKLAMESNPLYGVETVDKAVEFIKKNDVLNRALDSSISKAVKTHDDNFSANKLPNLIKEEREKIIKEMNPEETPEQKTIREQKERIDALEANGKRSDLKTELQTRAKELEYDGNIDLFVHFGDDAMKYMESEAERYKTAVESRVSTDIKNLYGGKTPRTNPDDAGKTMKRDAYEALSPTEQSSVDFTEITLVD